jgi:hypothetical protein
MRRAGLGLILLAVVIASPACMVSTQEGDRTHVNSPHPDEIAFHFDTPFNNALLYGRSLVLLLVPWWAWTSRRAGGGVDPVPIVLAVLATVAAGWLLISGYTKMTEYRIDVVPEGLSLQIPSQPPAQIHWSEIEEIEGDGKAYDVSFGDGGGHALKWATEWEDLWIRLADGRECYVDLRPLSVEQRGTLWRAIARNAELEVETWVVPEG